MIYIFLLLLFLLVYIKMLEITRKNCYKWDLETIIDNNSQYFWINLRDFEAETESKWLNIFNKHGNKSTLKYRRELTPNIKFQADRIFVRNGLFEQVIKSCKATNTKFLMFKENAWHMSLWRKLIWRRNNTNTRWHWRDR